MASSRIAVLVGPTKSADILMINCKKIVCRGSVICYIVPQRIVNMFLFVAETGDVENVITANRKHIVKGILLGVRNHAKVPILGWINCIPIRWCLV